MADQQINKNSSISLNLVFSLVGIAFASGVLWMKIETFDVRIANLETKISAIHDFIRPEKIAQKL